MKGPHRHPYLHESVLEWVGKNYNPQVSLNGENKSVLRDAGRLLGLNHSCTFRKRAIQFGSNLAKISNITKFGSNSKANGVAQYQAYPLSHLSNSNGKK